MPTGSKKEQLYIVTARRTMPVTVAEGKPALTRDVFEEFIGMTWDQVRAIRVKLDGVIDVTIEKWKVALPGEVISKRTIGDSFSMPQKQPRKPAAPERRIDTPATRDRPQRSPEAQETASHTGNDYADLISAMREKENVA